MNNRVRFLKAGYYEGFTTTIIDGKVNITDGRFFVDTPGRVYEIQDFILAKDGMVDIIFLDGSVYRAEPNQVELSAPSEYTPNPQNCCKDK